MSQVDTIEEIHRRQNVIEELAKLLVERLWTDKAGELQHLPQRFELAALAGGIEAAAYDLRELFDSLDHGTDE